MAYGTVSADVIQSSVANTSLGAGNASIMKNRLINGAMLIDQRYAGASTTSSGYLVDRWYTGAISGATLTYQQVTDAPSGFYNSLKTTVTSSSTTSDYMYLGQYIEGNNAYDLQWGTANGLTVTLSFWVKSSVTGTYNGLVRFFGATTYNYLPTYTINSANTWEQKTITIPAAPVGAGAFAGALNTSYIYIVPMVYTTSGYGSSTAANTWSSSGTPKVSGTVNFPSNASATFQFTGVQLEVGSSATGFEYRQYGQELALCQRYFAKIGGTTSTETLANGMSTDLNTAQYYCVYFPVTMRAAPTATISSIGGSDLANGTVTANSIRGQLSGVSTCQLGLNTNSAAWLTTYRPMAILTTATAGNISLSAEL